ncbi:MAG: ATP-dependent DNA ligase [Acidobacteriota bacterium]
MSEFTIQFRDGAVYLQQLGLWLDAHEPQPELVFVSHAHSDHVADHPEIIVSQPTSRLMQARLPGIRNEHVLPFDETKHFKRRGEDFEITLLPAGHIFGSAMSLIRAGGVTLLYTGDFKLRRGLSAEPCEPRQADLLIMETTFGKPHYVFPPANDILRSVVRFCREALDNDETPVLLGYSLGKSQELLCCLGEAGLPLMLHGSIFRLTKIYEQFGQCFPPYEPYVAGSARGKVLLCPPNVIGSAMLRNLGKVRTAVLTGWAVDPNCKYRYQCDAAFPLSDHADFPDLLELVKRVGPKRIYTLHGFAAEFAQTLREMGHDARALSCDEQFALPLAAAPAKPTTAQRIVAEMGSGEVPALNSELPPDSFAAFAQTCQLIRNENRKLEKVRVLAAYLKTIESDDLVWAVTWFTGRPFPPAQGKVLQLGWAVLRDALCAVAGLPEQAFHQAYLKHSDLGETAAELLDGRAPLAPPLRLEDVHSCFVALLAAKGPIAKMPMLRRTLERCTAEEAKFLVKVITSDLRIGLKEGLVEDAIAESFAQSPELVRNAHLLLGDLGETAKVASDRGLGSISLTPFRPIRFMLASPEETAADIWKRLEERNTESKDILATPIGEPKVTAWLEDKYDGIRCQLHKMNSRVALYSRDLKEITSTFLELADAIRRVAADFVLDGEIVAGTGTGVLPFAELQKRLGRREADLFMREEVPIKLVAFDLLWLNGVSLLDRPLAERRRLLEGISDVPAQLQLAQVTPAHSVEAIDSAFVVARARGNEGLMVKDPHSLYSPGRRGLAWLKLKRPFATLDCVVIGAEYGHGKRNKVLSDYTFAVRDAATGELKTIGKAYTGLTDAEIAKLTEHFLGTTLRQDGRYFEVPPDTVLEIAFDRLQRSDRHTSGIAMRFPRIVRIRTDKGLADIDTVQTARGLLERLEARKPARD